MPREFRLRSSEEIRQVVSSGSRVSNSIGTLHYQPANQNQFAIIVSKAIGSAVTRNLVKRRVRQVLRNHIDRDPTLKAALRMKPGVDKLSYQTLEEEVAALFVRAK